MNSYEHMKPMPLDQLLRKLAALSNLAASSSNEAPEVTLYSRTGQSFRGRILSYVDVPQSLILLGLEDQSERIESFLFLERSTVDGIAVHDASDIAHHFSDRLEPPREDPAPTRLKLRRDVKAISEWYESEIGSAIEFAMDWENAPRDDAALISLETLIAAVGEALRKISADSKGKEALANLDAINIALGDPGMTHRGKRLSLLVDLTKGPAGRFSTAALVDGIEKAI